MAVQFLLLGWGLVVANAGSLVAGDARGSGDQVEWAEKSGLAEHSLLLDADILGDRIVAVGERGHTLVSEDAGQSWLQADVPTRRMLTGIVLVDDSLCWAVGHDALVLHSADGGHSWEVQCSNVDAEAPLFDVWFEDARHGIAIGAYGLYVETHDGGRHWLTRRITQDDPHFYCLEEGADGLLYIIGESGLILRSADRGHNWSHMASPYEGSLFGITVTEDGSVLIFGLRGNIFRLDKADPVWRRVESGVGVSLLAGERMSDGSIVLVGLGGTVLHSRDHGRSFTRLPQGSFSGFSAAVDAGEGRTLLVGEGGFAWLERELAKEPPFE